MKQDFGGVAGAVCRFRRRILQHGRISWPDKGVCERGNFCACKSFVSAKLRGGFVTARTLSRYACCLSALLRCLRGRPPLRIAGPFSITSIGPWTFRACALACDGRSAHSGPYRLGLYAASARSVGRLCFDSCRPSLRHPSLALRDPAKKLGSALGICRYLPW